MLHTANGQWDVRYQKAFCFVGAEVPIDVDQSKRESRDI